MDKYTLGEVAYNNGYEKGFQDGIKHEKQVRENNNYAYQATMSKEDINKIPVMKKETIERGKRLLCNLYEDAALTDTNSKEYIEIQAYNKFAELMLELYEGDIINEMNCPVRIIRQNIKDIRDELIEEVSK